MSEHDPAVAHLHIPYQETPQSRLSILFRWFYVLPILFLSGVLTSVRGLLFLGPLIMLVLFKKYPNWWYQYNLQLSRFNIRIGRYIYFLTDQYPAVDDDQGIELRLPDPKQHAKSRFLPLIKWLLALPHYVILMLLALVTLILYPVLFLLTLILARVPKPLFRLIHFYLAYAVRVSAYSFLLTTDRYPPFS